ncbi:MAG: glycoside hydrolase family 9 protein [Lachnospiraceae bacterium]|nr:glycoside hydrolase family 9 protein [Lachnospiraceae bacterium]
MKKRTILYILIFSLLTACGGRKAATEEQSLADTVLAEVPYKEEEENLPPEDLSYAVPENIPGIKTVLCGYEPGEEKYAVFVGRELSGEYALLDAASGEEISRGTLRKREDTEEIFRADLSELEQEGDYILYCDEIGYSYPFSVKEGIYEGWLDAYLDTLNSEETRDAQLTASILLNLLQVAEFAPERYGTLPSELKGAVEWLLSLQDESAASGTEADTDTEILLAVALARYSDMTAAEDKAFSAQCLKAAELTAERLSGKRKDIADSAWYMLNAELLRSSGKDSYRDTLRNLLKNGAPRSGERVGPVDPVLWGDIAYLSSERGADRVQCEQIMSEIMSRAQEISRAVRDDPWLAGGEDPIEILEDAQLLTWVNGIVTNREYRNAIREKVHYLFGRNPGSASFVTERGVICKEAGNELYYGSVLAVVLSRIDIRYVQVE